MAAFPYHCSFEFKARGMESLLYPALRGVLVHREPDADAVLPATYADAAPEERATLDRLIESFVRILCEEPELRALTRAETGGA